jgi:hypothetical protein
MKWKSLMVLFAIWSFPLSAFADDQFDVGNYKEFLESLGERFLLKRFHAKQEGTVVDLYVTPHDSEEKIRIGQIQTRRKDGQPIEDFKTKAYLLVSIQITESSSPLPEMISYEDLIKRRVFSKDFSVLPNVQKHKINHFFKDNGGRITLPNLVDFVRDLVRQRRRRNHDLTRFGLVLRMYEYVQYWNDEQRAKNSNDTGNCGSSFKPK